MTIEEKALELYPKATSFNLTGAEYDPNNDVRQAYIRGYNDGCESGFSRGYDGFDDINCNTTSPQE